MARHHQIENPGGFLAGTHVVSRDGHVIAVILRVDADESVVVDLVVPPHRRALHPIAVCHKTHGEGVLTEPRALEGLREQA